MDFSQILEKRHSTRAFKLVEIEEEKLQSILEAARGAPSAGNLQAWKVCLIKDRKKKEQLVQVASGQKFISQAPVIFVFLADPESSAEEYGQRGRELYSLQDATIACVFAWLEAVNQGLAGCWVGAFNEEMVKKILNLPERFLPVAILPIGYAAETPESTSRSLLEEKIFKSV